MHQNADLDMLVSTWERSDRRKSLFAPGVEIFQALTASGATASGLGDCRQGAVRRCLGETAEILAREAAGMTGPGYSNLGYGARTDAAQARAAALCEASERLQIWQWWQGQRHAAQVPEPWLAANGAAGWLAQQRAGAEIGRKTACWVLQPGDAVQVAICRSTSIRDQDPILGFGAAFNPADAVAKALRETLLMEMNLIEVMAARAGLGKSDSGWIEARIAQYATRTAAILPEREADMSSQATLHPPPQETLIETLAADLRPLPLACGARLVWACSLPETGQLPTGSAASPFMSPVR